MSEIKADVVRWLDNRKDDFHEIAKNIWQHPEVGLKEEYASDLQKSTLREEGFRVVESIANMETAFYAEYGEGGPTIGVLGEYDALPGLSQKVKPQRDPLQEGKAGHGCGHNLLGTAGMAGVMAIKKGIEAGEIRGKVRYYGCPAEETLVGKVYMARAGVFDGLDACLTWHPGVVNCAKMGSSLAMNSIQFKFTGQSSHAAASPEQGRSALDGVELMNLGSEYMREHLSDKARIHYSIPKGGEEPNIVPDEAITWYYVRAPKREEVEEVTDWLYRVAEGASLMARVNLEPNFLTACFETNHNRVLSDIVLGNMQDLGGPNYSEEDIKFAKEIEKTLNRSREEALKEKGIPEEVCKKTLHSEVLEEYYDVGGVSPGSTDVGDVSWITPLAEFSTATWPMKVTSHSWQATASSGSGIGMAGMHFAAKTIATSLVDLFNAPEVLEKAKEEFKEKTKGGKYESPLPEDAEPASV